MGKGVFITGTSTDAGKTYISSLIVKSMRENGYNCGYFKPVLTGVEIKNNNIYMADIEYVKKISGLDYSSLELVSYYYKYPASAHLSSRLENRVINIDKILLDYKQLLSTFDYLVVEGIGGIICPYIYEKDNVLMQEDVIKLLNIPAVLVCRLKLGVINSSLLSINYAKSMDININTLVFNMYQKDIIYDDSINLIKSVSKIENIILVQDNVYNLNIENIKRMFIQ